MDSRFEAEVTVRFVRYANTETGWAVLDATHADGTLVALVGPLVHLEERERVQISGTWVQDSRYGPQVKVAQARPLAPDDPQALAAYLKRVKHVGARRAANLVSRYGAAEVLDAIDRDPAAAFAVAGLSRQPSRGRLCGSPAACTCCWRPTALPISPDGSTSTTATARTNASSPTPTS